MNKDILTECVNGELRPGDLVLSTPDDEYACLVGRVTEIAILGTPEHETENETDDVYVDFTEFDYSDQRIAEIEKMISALYGEKKAFDDCPIDLVIMGPESLIRITGIDHEQLYELLDCEEKAAAFCKSVQRKYNLSNNMEDVIDMDNNNTTASAVETAAPTQIDVKVRPIEPKGKLIGYADVNFGGVITVHDFRLINDEKGMFVGNPSRPDDTSRTGYRSTALLVGDDIKERINNAARAAYVAEVEKLQARAAAVAAPEKPRMRDQLEKAGQEAAKHNAEKILPDKEIAKAARDDR